MGNLARHLQNLKQERLQKKHEQKSKGRQRRKLTAQEREKILLKTDGCCHICGDKVGEKWQADHIKAHSTGGQDSVENFLPAHPVCNNYRWDYSGDEFQLILKLGVWIKTQIEKGTVIGKTAEDKFTQYEIRREARGGRKSNLPSL